MSNESSNHNKGGIRAQASKRQNLQASFNETRASVAQRGFKRAGARLDGVIRWVNLVSRDAHLPEKLVESPQPTESELKEALIRLPFKDLSVHLLKVFEGGFHLASPETGGIESVSFGPAIGVQLLIRHYDDIRSAREVFYEIARKGSDRNVTVRGRSLITINNKHIMESRLDPLSEAVQGVDARYIRECPECGRIFFAGRIYDDPRVGAGCSRKCNKKARNDKWIFLAEHGYRPGMKLTRKEKAEKEALINAWYEQKKEGRNHEHL